MVAVDEVFGIAAPNNAPSFDKGDDDPLEVTVTSSNTDLVSSSAIEVTPDGNEYELSITPSASQPGTTTITVTVSDGVLSGSTEFVLTVIQDEASILGITDTEDLQNLIKLYPVPTSHVLKLDLS